MEKVRGKIRTTLSPRTHGDPVRTKILGLNRIISGWCRYYQITSSPSYCFNKLRKEVFWLMAHWLGRKYQMSIPKVMGVYRRGNTFGTATVTLGMPDDFKAKRHRLRVIPNPYTSRPIQAQREDLDTLEEIWLGRERRKGEQDRKKMVYDRDQGICGLCGKFVPWHEADLDHRTPRHLFNPPEGANSMENQWILHRTPCHRQKTKKDLQRGRRVR
jgi:5-methylcytosine-specific restriction endonuclease McrA